MKIEEFLLARISEDEARLDLPEAAPILNSQGEISVRGEGWVSRGDCPACGAYQFAGEESVTEEAWWAHAEGTHGRSRVLAECESKRRIVGAWIAADETAGAFPGTDAGVEIGLHEALEHLALPYAEHPDHDPTWGK